MDLSLSLPRPISSFRELYEHAIKDPVKLKMLLIDQTRSRVGWCRHPPGPASFLPDLIRDVSEEEIINLDLQQFLKDRAIRTGPEMRMTGNMPEHCEASQGSY